MIFPFRSFRFEPPFIQTYNYNKNKKFSESENLSLTSNSKEDNIEDNVDTKQMKRTFVTIVEED